VPAVNLRIQSLAQLATRSSSIKQIEISRVHFENHLPGQMDTILIQKGNSITATVAMDMTKGARRLEQTRSETRLRLFNAD
jgi:hypothetical protein